MKVLYALSVVALLVGCEGAGDPPESEPDAGSCAFDPALEGRVIGDQIRDFGLRTYTGDERQLHGSCGADRQLVWIVLATGWCGACEGYAAPLEEIWQDYQDRGLSIMWVLGETEEYDEPVSFEWAQRFVDDRGVTYPVFRDFKFYQVYGAIEPHSSALPHQYLLDATNMELIHAQGGTGAEIEEIVFSRLADVTPTPRDAGL